MSHKCNYCGVEKPESEFRDNNKSKCRECYNTYQNRRRRYKKARHDTPRHLVNLKGVSQFEKEMREWKTEEYKKHCISCKHFHITRTMLKDEFYIFGWCKYVKQRTPIIGNLREVCGYYEEKC